MVAVRILLSLIVAAALVFCAFGITATFEPLPESRQWAWRIVYGSIGAACLAGLGRLWMRRR